MLHGAGSLEYSSAQASTSYYAPSSLEYERHHSPAPPSLDDNENLFSNDDADAEMHSLVANRSSSSSNMGQL
jgi:hypothetical protein